MPGDAQVDVALADEGGDVRCGEEDAAALGVLDGEEGIEKKGVQGDGVIFDEADI